MKTKFPAYYRIHKDDILKRFDECIFMFDTSALLDVFRLKKDLSEKVFEVITHYVSQIRIPYHVAEEYNRRIHTVLNEQLNNIKNSQKAFEAFVHTFEAKRSMPYINKETKDTLDLLKQQIDQDYKSQEDYVKEQLLHGEYQNRMADILDGKVLDPFTSEELDAIKIVGESRYANKIAPGYKDASKDDNRFGDLINWKEILRFAKDSDKNIIFVANDEKEDWVCKENGMTIGPLYDLLKEFYSEIGTNKRFFHIYTLDRFLALVNEKDNAVISTDVVKEVKDYIENAERVRTAGRVELPPYAFLYNCGVIKTSGATNEDAGTFRKSEPLYKEFTERLKAVSVPIAEKNAPTQNWYGLPSFATKGTAAKEKVLDAEIPQKANEEFKQASLIDESLKEPKGNMDDVLKKTT